MTEVVVENVAEVVLHFLKDTVVAVVCIVEDTVVDIVAVVVGHIVVVVEYVAVAAEISVAVDDKENCRKIYSDWISVSHFEHIEQYDCIEHFLTVAVTEADFLSVSGLFDRKH